MQLSALVAAVAILSLQPLHAQQQFTWQEELPPLKMSFKDLEKISRRVVDTVGKVRGHSWEIASGQRTVTFSDEGVTDLTSTELPEFASNASYRYFDLEHLDSFSSSPAPVTLVSLHLSNHRRELRVQGSSPDETEKLFRIILADLDGLATLGGFNGSMVVLLGIGLVLLALVAYRWHHAGVDAAERLALVCFAAMFALFLSTLWWQPLLLPGFAVFSGEVAWYRRNGLELGLILGVAGAAVPTLQILFARLRLKNALR